MGDNFDTKASKDLNIINAFMDGNEDVEEEVENIIDEIETNLISYRIIMFKMARLVNLSEMITFTSYNKLTHYNCYKNLMDKIHDHVKIANASINTLTKYFKIAAKRRVYPDLDAAYLLAYNIPLILDNISDILTDVRQGEKDINKYDRLYYIEQDYSYPVSMEALNQVVKDSIETIKHV